MSFVAIVALLTITSCTKEDVNIQEIENYTEASLDGIERSCKTGKHGCFEFVWPIALEFADGTVTEFDDQEQLRAGIKAWKEQYPNATAKPDLVFPLDILDEEGTLFNIATQEELRTVVRSCRDNFGRRGHAKKSCFDVNYPISIVYPDASTASFDDRRSLKEALREWKEANPDAETRPAIEFPINVTMKDTDEMIEVNSKEELQALKEDCRNN